MNKQIEKIPQLESQIILLHEDNLMLVKKLELVAIELDNKILTKENIIFQISASTAECESNMKAYQKKIETLKEELAIANREKSIKTEDEQYEIFVMKLEYKDAQINDLEEKTVLFSTLVETLKNELGCTKSELIANSSLLEKKEKKCKIFEETLVEKDLIISKLKDELSTVQAIETQKFEEKLEDKEDKISQLQNEISLLQSQLRKQKDRKGDQYREIIEEKDNIIAKLLKKIASLNYSEDSAGNRKTINQLMSELGEKDILIGILKENLEKSSGSKKSKKVKKELRKTGKLEKKKIERSSTSSHEFEELVDSPKKMRKSNSIIFNRKNKLIRRKRKQRSLKGNQRGAQRWKKILQGQVTQKLIMTMRKRKNPPNANLPR